MGVNGPLTYHCLFRLNLKIYNGYVYLEPFDDPCFDWKRPCFGGLKPQNRGPTGSRYIYIYLFTRLSSFGSFILYPLNRWSLFFKKKKLEIDSFILLALLPAPKEAPAQDATHFPDPPGPVSSLLPLSKAIYWKCGNCFVRIQNPK